MAQPSWRKIESALIELLREEGFTIGEYRGNTFIVLTIEDSHHQICVGDFARELEARIA